MERQIVGPKPIHHRRSLFRPGLGHGFGLFHSEGGDFDGLDPLKKRRSSGEVMGRVGTLGRVGAIESAEIDGADPFKKRWIRVVSRVGVVEAEIDGAGSF